MHFHKGSPYRYRVLLYQDEYRHMPVEVSTWILILIQYVARSPVLWTEGRPLEFQNCKFSFLQCLQSAPMAVAEGRDMKCLHHLRRGGLSSNLTSNMDARLRVSCVGSGLATGWSPVQGVLPTAYKRMQLKCHDVWRIHYAAGKATGMNSCAADCYVTDAWTCALRGTYTHRTTTTMVAIVTMWGVTTFIVLMIETTGLVVRVHGYRPRGPAFDSRRYHTFWVVVGLEQSPLNLMRTNEELPERKSRGSGLKNRD
jgi:hypothetical protein